MRAAAVLASMSVIAAGLEADPAGAQDLRPPPLSYPPFPPPPSPSTREYVVYFGPSGVELTTHAEAMIAEAAAYAVRGGFTDIRVVGHTDTVGSAADNQTLSLRRAEIVREGLVAAGAGSVTYTIEGRGEAELARPTADEVYEFLNRRVSILVHGRPPPVFPPSPQPPPPPPPAYTARYYSVVFATGSADLTPQARGIIGEAARYAIVGDFTDIRLIGRTDTVGDEDDNQALSFRRAQEVRDALVAAGARGLTYTLEGRGESDLARPTPDETADWVNRNVEIEIHGWPPPPPLQSGD